MKEENPPMLSYEQVGRGDETLVFLHGFMGTGADWKPLVEKLARTYSCVLIDLPGHGKSFRALGAEQANLEGMGAAVLSTLDALGLEKVHLVGYSMGGRIALYLAIQHRERVRSLVLESASPGLTDIASRKARARQDEARAADMRSKGLEDFLDHWYAMALFSDLKQSPGYEQMLARRREGDLPSLARILEEMSPGVQPDLWPRLGQLQVPSLWLAGARDQKYRALVKDAASYAPGAEVEIIPGAGHNVHLEAPDRLAIRLRDFLGAHTS